MKKIFLTLLFNILFSAQCFAQTIANHGIDEASVNSLVRDAKNCWECNLIEGIYTYTFNFVFKMYKVLQPIIYQVVIVFLGIWFIWFIATKVIKEQKGDIRELLKEFFVKIFTIVFVWAMLVKVPANEIFKYTIDPIMSFGAGFGKWILVETRNENSIMQNTKLFIKKDKEVLKYNCDDINLSQSTLNMFKNNGIDTEDEMNTDTLKNMICITREYSNSYTVGFRLGLKIVTKGLIGIASNFVAQKITEGARTGASLFSFIPGWGKVVSIVSGIILFFFQIFLWFGWFVNFVIVVLGLGITICFMYVALTYILLILDIIIKLAMVGVMMPITIGAWAFSSNDMTNLRGKLSGKLFWDVLRCSFRLAFLAIAMGISIFLLNELMTTTFDTDDTIVSLYESLVENQSALQHATQWSGVNQSTLDLLNLFISNTGMFVAIILTTLISWMLLTESNKMADSFADSLYSGVKNDTILKGLKTLTLSTIKYIKDGAKPDQEIFIKMKEAKKIGKKQIGKKQNDTYTGGNSTSTSTSSSSIIDLPPEVLVDRFNNQRLNSYTPNPQPQPLYGLGPQNRFRNDIDELKKVNMKIDRVNTINKPKNDFINSKLERFDEYKNLSSDEKMKVQNIIFLDSNQEFKEVEQSTPAIAELVNKIRDSEIVSKNRNDGTAIFTYTNVDKQYFSDSPFEQLKEEYVRHEILQNTRNLKDSEKKSIRNFITNGQSFTNTNPQTGQKFKNQSAEQQYKKLEQEIKSTIRSQKIELDSIGSLNNLLKEQNELTKIHNVLGQTKLTAKSVIQSIKQDELNDLIKEIDNLDGTTLLQRGINTAMHAPYISHLRKQVKKLEKEINNINEKNDLELEEEYDEIVEKWQKKKKRKSRINPERKT